MRNAWLVGCVNTAREHG